MISDKQLEANRQNAKKGGVKSEPGKSASRINAVKHNLLGNLLSDEESQDAKVLTDELAGYFEPESIIEEILVDRIAVWIVRLKRATRAETEQIKMIHDPTITENTGGLLLEWGEKTEIIHQGYSPKVTPEHIELLAGIYLRYESEIEQRLYKAIRELKMIQWQRKKVDKKMGSFREKTTRG